MFATTHKSINPHPSLNSVSNSLSQRTQEIFVIQQCTGLGDSTKMIKVWYLHINTESEGNINSK